MTDFTILFEDEDILAIDKPAGVVVNKADSIQGETVQSWMEERMTAGGNFADGWYSLLPETFTEEYGSPQDIFLERGGVVHRLDKDTSGVLLLAKNPGAMLNLMSQFKLRETEKEYTCLVHGKFSSKKDTIRLPMMRSMKERHKFEVSATGKPAETNFRVLEEFTFPEEKLLKLLTAEGMLRGKTDNQILKEYQGYTDFSLISCQPKTGRTHQIRVHFAFLQHPLVGDQVYANKWRAKADFLWCPRQFLHASNLTFKHPRTREKMTIEAPLENDLSATLKKLVPTKSH